MFTFLTLIVCAVTIYLACEYFVNAIEWLGHRANVGETATGSILAAFGTALPESAVTAAAVIFGKSEAAKSIGIGAALGGPLVLATISYATVGFMLILCAKGLARKTLQLELNQRQLANDQRWFLIIFLCKILLGVVAFQIKPLMGWLFLAAYGLYIRKEMQRAEDTCELLEPLKFSRTATLPAWHWILLQTIGAIIVTALASHYFVGALEQVSPLLGLSPQLTALLLSPLATELPETMNAIIWLRQGKENLALANISGAMMIQATIPSALGMFFTPWHFDGALLVAGIATSTSILFLYFLFSRGKAQGKQLLWSGSFYLLFAASCMAII